MKVRCLGVYWVKIQKRINGVKGGCKEAGQKKKKKKRLSLKLNSVISLSLSKILSSE